MDLWSSKHELLRGLFATGSQGIVFTVNAVKHKSRSKAFHKLAAALVFLMALLTLLSTQTSPVHAVTIPDGCPGSSNPQNPPPDVCKTIPLGCPGTSLQGPVATQPTDCPYETPLNLGEQSATGDTCGGGNGDKSVKISLNIGCSGNGNPIIDAMFAILRFLSVGVGIVAVTMMIVAGIQYTASQGNPNATAAALKRIRNVIIALLLYFFIYALMNWLIPGGAFS